MPFQQSLLVALLVVSAVLGRSLVDLNAEAGNVLHGRSLPALEIRTTDRSKKGSLCLNIITSVLKTPGTSHPDEP
ncbi:hypothetical protein KEM48_009447 [Puccinia striiformis f. sp. tritici PST-130]|nr:hypothetical protein KEM48_009447 [Puccinia striiformis f. sp. tritici PST-130]